jgi:hypothetical protein
MSDSHPSSPVNSNDQSNTNAQPNSNANANANGQANTNAQPNSDTQSNTTNTSTQTNTRVILNETIIDTGLVINNLQTATQDINVVTETNFNTTDPNAVPQITENLRETVEYNYDDNVITESDNLVNEIRHYAQQIKCEDFHGKGTIDDYSELFKAASKIANDSKQMQLDIDIDGFDEFGKAADELSALFASFTKKLQNINIINDSIFLKGVLDALKKIYNLSEVFGRFKETILVTSEIKIPKTAHDTKDVLVDVMSEVNCAINYINHFVVPDPNLTQANLSASDKNIISKAVSTIDNWQTLCEQGVSIALQNSSDMQYLKNTNIELKQKTSVLKSVTSALKLKINSLNQN